MDLLSAALVTKHGYPPLDEMTPRWYHAAGRRSHLLILRAAPAGCASRLSVGGRQRGGTEGGNRGGVTVEADRPKWETTQATQLVGASLEL